MGVSVSLDNLKDSSVNGQKGDIEGSTSKIEDEDVSFFVLLVETIGDSGGGRLIDDSQNVQSRDHTGVLGGLSLRVVEVSRDCDDGVFDLSSEVAFSNGLHLGQDHSRDLLRTVLLLDSLNVNLDIRLSVLINDLIGKKLLVMLDFLVVVLPSNKSLDGINSSGGVDGPLVLCGFSD
mmetsp:Transcript_18055/g.18703  ORF Transcript_18055/g.18703 Transcript_18055/m.18703 type:complete len:177 (+) Transcript_18055:1258-1788(+)